MNYDRSRNAIGLYHTLDDFTSPKFKLLHFSKSQIFWKDKKGASFLLG